MIGLIGFLVTNVLPDIANYIAQGYLIFLALGLGIMLLAGLSSIIWSLVRQNKQ